MELIRRDVIDALVWLDLAHVQALMFALVKGAPSSWQGAVERLVPDLRGEADMTDPRWREAMLDELEIRLAGVEPEVDLDTREVPNLARFAADVRSTHEVERVGLPVARAFTDETEPWGDQEVTEPRAC